MILIFSRVLIIYFFFIAAKLLYTTGHQACIHAAVNAECVPITYKKLGYRRDRALKRLVIVVFTRPKVAHMT